MKMRLHHDNKFQLQAATQEAFYLKSKTETTTAKGAHMHLITEARMPPCSKCVFNVRWPIHPVIRKYTEICIRTSPSLRESNPLGMRHTCSRDKKKKKKDEEEEDEEAEETPFKYSLTA